MAGFAGAWGTWNTAMENNYERLGTTTKRRDLSPEAMNQLIYQVLSSDAGLAALSQGENMSGGHSSTTKALLAQDLTTKIAGELAALTAPEITSNEDVKTTKEGRAVSKIGDFGDKYNFFNDKSGGTDSVGSKTVICTELNRQGLLSDELYHHPKALEHFEELPAETVRGYHSWAERTITTLASSPRLSRCILPIAVGRYKMITTGQWNLLGWITIAIAQPICWLIGKIIIEMEKQNGRSEFAA